MLIHFEFSSAAYKRKSVKEILTKHVRSHQEREYIMKRMVESIFNKKFTIFMVMFVVCFLGLSNIQCSLIYCSSLLQLQKEKETLFDENK